MKALILAAGRGSRLGPLTLNCPKGMVKLNGKSLIEWQHNALKSTGIHSIGMVIGYLKEHFKIQGKYFENKQWETSNMVTSMLSARDWLEKDTCIISYSDIVYSENVVKKLMDSQGDIVISYDPNWLELWEKRFTNPLLDAETFKIDSSGRITEIGGRAITCTEIMGQYMGLIKITSEGWKWINTVLEQKMAYDIDKMDMTALLNLLIKEGISITGVAIEDKWYEVDSENDIIVYERMIKNYGMFGNFYER